MKKNILFFFSIYISNDNRLRKLIILNICNVFKYNYDALENRENSSSLIYMHRNPVISIPTVMYVICKTHF